MTETRLQALVDGLRTGQYLDLDDDQTTALLSWLGGSTRDSGANVLRAHLGAPGEDEAVRAAAFEQLDFALFDGERLLIRSAGVDDGRDERERRRRFRLLLSVFHPDRYPARSEWLTSRLQIVNRVYSDFKAGRLKQDSRADESPVVRPAPGTRKSDPPPVWRGISPNWTVGERLLSRLGRDPYLGHKIVGVLLLLIALPVVSILLDSTPERGDVSPVEDPEQTREVWIGQDLDLALEQWPPESREPEWLVVSEPVRSEEISDEIAMDQDVDLDAPDLPRWLALAQVMRPAVTPLSIVIAEQDSREDEVRDTSPPEPSPARDDEPLKTQDALPRLADRAEEAEAQPVQEVEQTVSVAADEAEAMPEPEPDPEPAATEVASVAMVPDPVDTEAREATEDAASEVDHGVELKPGTLSMGLLGNHRVGNLLSDYRESVETGDIHGVLNVLGRHPRENDNEGRVWFERQYQELFDSSRQRSLTMQVRNARRSGSDWLVEVKYELEIEPVDSVEFEQMEREVRYSIAPDPFQLRIVAVEY